MAWLSYADVGVVLPSMNTTTGAPPMPPIGSAGSLRSAFTNDSCVSFGPASYMARAIIRMFVHERPTMPHFE